MSDGIALVSNSEGAVRRDMGDKMGDWLESSACNATNVDLSLYLTYGP